MPQGTSTTSAERLLAEAIHPRVIIVTTETRRSTDLLNTLQQTAAIVGELRTSAEILTQPMQDAIVLFDCSRYPPEAIHHFLQSLSDRNPDFRAALWNTDINGDYDALAHWPQIKGLFQSATPVKEMINGLRKIQQNRHWFPRKLAEKLIEHYRQPPASAAAIAIELTRREKEILQALKEGMSNQDMAALFGVSDHTIKSHLYKVFKKIGVKNRLQAHNWACRNLL